MSLLSYFPAISEDFIDSLRSLNDLIKEHVTDVEKAEITSSLEEVTKGFISVHDNNKAADISLRKVENYVNLAVEDEDRTTIDVDALYKNGLEKVNRPFQESEIWMNVFGLTADIEEIAGTEESVCINYEKINDSLMCSNEFQPPVDPLTKKLINNPCKNIKCGHIYEYQTILKYIQSMKRKAKCPFMGCVNRQLAEADLRIDDDMKQKIMEYNNSS